MATVPLSTDLLPPRRSIPWPRILAEGFAIVVSILLAFGIQAWWEGRQHSEEEQELLATIHADLVASQESLRRNMQAVEADQSALRAFAALSEPEAAAAPPETTWGSYLVNLWRFRTAEVTLGSVEATINSGKLELIRAPLLRAALVEAMTAAAGFAEQAAVITQLSVDGTRSMNRHAEVARELTARAGSNTPLEPMIEPSAFVRMRADPEIMTIVASKVLYWNAYLLEARRLLERLEETVGMVEQSLQPGS